VAIIVLLPPPEGCQVSAPASVCSCPHSNGFWKGEGKEKPTPVPLPRVCRGAGGSLGCASEGGGGGAQWIGVELWGMQPEQDSPQ
jgi:hypothetical protein